MDYTQMRFKDLLVSDLGPLPADATINEDIYELLTLPYSLGTDMNSRFEMYRYHGDDSRYQIQMTLSQGTMDTKLETDISVIDGKAEITEYNGEVSMLRVSGPRVGHERVKLKFEDKDYEGSPSPFQEYLAEISSATLWMNGIANNKRANVDIIQYDNVTKESVGILYHMMNNMDIEPIPTELRDRLSPECLRIKLGDGEHTVSVLRPEAKVDGECLEERFDASYSPETGTLEISREARSRDEKTLRRLVTEGKPLVTHTSKSIVIDGEMTAMNYLVGVRNIMTQLREQPVAAEELLDGLSQDGLQL